jgi:hypothetical protein
MNSRKTWKLSFHILPFMSLASFSRHSFMLCNGNVSFAFVSGNRRMDFGFFVSVGDGHV